MNKEEELVNMDVLDSIHFVKKNQLLIFFFFYEERNGFNIFVRPQEYTLCFPE